MKKKNISQFWLFPCIFASAIFTVGIYDPSAVRANTLNQTIVALEFPPGPNRQAPKSTVGGGVRGKVCASGSLPLTAIMPSRNNDATTTSGNPTLFVYIPETVAKTAEFVINDEQGTVFLSDEIVLPGQPGIISIIIPQSKPLEIGENYQWEFSLVCETESVMKGTSLKGNIERIDLTAETKNKLAQTTNPIEQAKIYATNNIWTETLKLLAEQRVNQPQEWEELLNSVGLKDFAKSPIVN